MNGEVSLFESALVGFFVVYSFLSFMFFVVTIPAYDCGHCMIEYCPLYEASLWQTVLMFPGLVLFFVGIMNYILPRLFS